ncbi:hypothetical protein [Streptomyces sp. SP18CS02]|uniref:hypothetical protein n=1 Tax=Streptomyces sp. SP18CS02 TaxID=3002531 RepID=UPI002E75B1A0|nr:hypothetical protein [Streptomyces sp. SP18CS02]MEE1757019.1 hypothetical protein [Streptomyces sp. SP18CS02]
MPLIEHDGGHYAIRIMYAVPDDAWYLELDVTADRKTVALAIVPDEDPEREPTVCFGPDAGHRHIPYDVMTWFMDHVAQEIRTSRAWMRLRPDLVGVVRLLRETFMGVAGDDEYPALLVILRERLTEEDVATVIEGAFGPDMPVPGPVDLPPDRVRAVRERMAGPDGPTDAGLPGPIG